LDNRLIAAQILDLAFPGQLDGNLLKHPPETREAVGEGHTERLEVVFEVAGGEAGHDPAGESGVEPGELLHHSGDRTQRQQDRQGGVEAARQLREQRGAKPERAGQVVGKADVMLAQADAVETEVDGEAGLMAQLHERRRRLEAVMDVE